MKVQILKKVHSHFNPKAIVRAHYNLRSGYAAYRVIGKWHDNKTASINRVNTTLTILKFAGNGVMPLPAAMYL
jgi:hypothetical protein